MVAAVEITAQEPRPQISPLGVTLARITFHLQHPCLVLNAAGSAGDSWWGGVRVCISKMCWGAARRSPQTQKGEAE